MKSSKRRDTALPAWASEVWASSTRSAVLRKKGFDHFFGYNGQVHAHHAGADKAGIHLFRVERGCGSVETGGTRYGVRPGKGSCVGDLRQPRTYLPEVEKRLVTAAFRFHGPELEAWREALGKETAIVFRDEKAFVALRSAQRLLR